jgi:hypothetical protein
MKDPAIVRDHALGDFWVRTRKVPPAYSIDLEWFVFDKNPTQGGEVLEHGRIDGAINDDDADRKAGDEMIAAIGRLTVKRNQMR